MTVTETTIIRNSCCRCNNCYPSSSLSSRTSCPSCWSSLLLYSILFPVTPEFRSPPTMQSSLDFSAPRPSNVAHKLHIDGVNFQYAPHPIRYCDAIKPAGPPRGRERGVGRGLGFLNSAGQSSGVLLGNILEKYFLRQRNLEIKKWRRLEENTRGYLWEDGRADGWMRNGTENEWSDGRMDERRPAD